MAIVGTIVLFVVKCLGAQILIKLLRCLTGAAIVKKEDAMDEKHHESRQFNLQLSSEISSAKAKLEQESDRGASASIHQEHRLKNVTQSFVNLFATHISGREEGRSENINENENDGGVENDTNYEKRCCDKIYVERDNGDFDCGDIDGGDHVQEDHHHHHHHHHHKHLHSQYHPQCYRRYDHDGDDDDDDDDDDGVGGDKDDNDDDHNNSDRDDSYREGACYSPTADEGVPKESNMHAGCQPQNSKFGLHVGNSKNKENRSTENITSTSNKNTDDETLPESGGKTYFNSQNVPLGNNATNINQGARPKMSSQGVPQDNVVDRTHYYNSRIPSLEVTGINEGFLARHTTDTSLPNASNSSDFNLSAESTSFALRCHASSMSKNNSDMLWSLPPPHEGMLRWQRPYANALQHADVGHQATTPTMRFRSDWQLSHQPQSERNASFIPREEQWLSNHIDPWTANQQQSLAHGSLLRHFPGATGTQDGNSLNRHGWMSNSYGSNWHYPRNDLHSSGINTSRVAWNEPILTLPAVKSRAPAVVPPSVTLPETRPQSTSSSVASNSFSSNDFSGLNENGQEWLEYSTRLRQNVSQNQENRRLTSSEMVSSRREELRSSNSGTQEASLAPGTSQQSSLASNANDDYTLAALERKVAEACAVVERVMKERDERIKAKREAAQREREIRERNEREARERREREARERNEREERERVQRERREREAREREIREREAREARERRRIQEQEGEERERTVARERAPVQENLRWQCQHYQRRCKVSFPCCGVFYPCHRCHNGSGACDAADMKANQATHVKCGNCGYEEEVSNVIRMR